MTSKKKLTQKLLPPTKSPTTLTPDDINQEYNCSYLPKEAQSTISPPGVTHEAHSTWSKQGVRAKLAPSSIKGDNRNKEYYILLSAKLNAPNLVSTHGQEHYLFTQNERTALRTLLVSNTKGKDQLAVKTTLEKHLQVSNQEHNLLMFADKLHPINRLISNVHKLAQACCKKLHSKPPAGVQTGAMTKACSQLLKELH